MASTNPEEHLQDLQAFFHRLRQHNIFIELKKCRFFQDELQFLDFQIHSNGTSIPKDKVDGIKLLQMPASPRLLYALLQHFNYYRRLVKDYAAIASPLYAVSDHSKPKK